MNIQEHTSAENIEKYSFLWSEARLVIAAVALFIGGQPPLLKILPGAYGLLGLFWLVSGVAAGYLLYRWFKVRTLFGAKEKLDLYAFFVMVVSGINLGLTPLVGNIGMSLLYNKLVFLVVGVLYLASAYHLYRRWLANNKRIF